MCVLTMEILLTVSMPSGVPHFAGYIFDLDGTVYLGNELLPGSAATLAAIRASGASVLFLSNNPTRSIRDYQHKLEGLGIEVHSHEILNTVATMVMWLQRYHPNATVYPISEQPLIDALTAAGIAITDDPAGIDFVIASYDRTFAYPKLQIAYDAIAFHKRARLITTNPDRFCPFPGGRGEPDAGAIIGAIEGCTGVRCEQNVGKPDPFMLEAALTRLNLTAADCIMVGDRLHTDIRMAVMAGMASALVLTGDSTMADVDELDPEWRPTWVLEGIGGLLPASSRAHM